MINRFPLFFHKNSHKIFLYFFVAFFALQIFFWLKTENIKPQYNIVPNLPNSDVVKVLSAGDDEFLFRVLALRIQNSGDVFAGFIALKDYDYLKLYQWFLLLDSLNEKSNLVPSLASYYFSQSPNKSDVAYVERYLEEHSLKNVDANWWWLFQAIELARTNLQDNNLALKLAYKLSENNAKNAPLWTKQMPAFIHARRGEGCMAFAVIQKLIDENNAGVRQISVEEMNFMRYFIGERLAKLKNQGFNPKKCQTKNETKY